MKHPLVHTTPAPAPKPISKKERARLIALRDYQRECLRGARERAAAIISATAGKKASELTDIERYMIGAAAGVSLTGLIPRWDHAGSIILLPHSITKRGGKWHVRLKKSNP